MATLRRAAMVALMGLVAAVATQAVQVKLPEGLSYDFHAQSCPNLEKMVQDAVQVAMNKDVGVLPGLLKIFFHDCFPQGCDASLLLTGPGSELEIPENAGLWRSALDLIESIRATVHGACGPTVSCADITNLATRQAVMMQSRVPWYVVPLGHNDSLAPATRQQVKAMPGTDATADKQIKSFASRGFDEAELVALSGAHTIGQATCGAFINRTGQNSEFVASLQRNCSIRPTPPLQDLDVTTPTTFDNYYYHNLKAKTGVFNSDMALTHGARTIQWVNKFAGNQTLFFETFSTSMSKLAHLPVNSTGEIRNNCFRLNHQGFTASA